ncbi:MAG: DnaD domain protein [bacterium]|nr:DnaD domain protein [bacterium]
MNQIVELLKSKNYQLSKELLFNYKKLNISEQELIIIIYLDNQQDNIYNPKKISDDLNIEFNSTLEFINKLCEKGILKLEMEKINNVRNEVISMDLLYEKLAFSLTQDSPKDESNIYDIFETEFGRTLSPMEFEIINGWLNIGYSEELIKMALKEATYNGVSNLRYIDKIIYEWDKKGIKTKEDVEKNRKSFKNNSSKNKELFDYDWLNDTDN